MWAKRKNAVGLEVFLRLNCTHIRGYMHIPDINPLPFQTKKNREEFRGRNQGKGKRGKNGKREEGKGKKTSLICFPF